MQLSRSKLDIRYLTDAFPLVEFVLYQSDDPECFISCFVARFKDASVDPDIWLEITSLIAVNFQASLTNDFATWNIYLALVFPKAVSRHLKYKIESNRFALRKIVLVSDKGILETSEQTLHALEEMILGKDLELGPMNRDLPLKSSSSFVREVISSTEAIPADGKEKSSQTRKQHIAELLSRIPQP